MQHLGLVDVFWHGLALMYTSICINGTHSRVITTYASVLISIVFLYYNYDFACNVSFPASLDYNISMENQSIVHVFLFC